MSRVWRRLWSWWMDWRVTVAFDIICKFWDGCLCELKRIFLSTVSKDDLCGALVSLVYGRIVFSRWGWRHKYMWFLAVMNIMDQTCLSMTTTLDCCHFVCIHWKGHAWLLVLETAPYIHLANTLTSNWFAKFQQFVLCWVIGLHAYRKEMQIM